jgi:hypothetical protein
MIREGRRRGLTSMVVVVGTTNEDGDKVALSSTCSIKIDRWGILFSREDKGTWGRCKRGSTGAEAAAAGWI